MADHKGKAQHRQTNTQPGQPSTSQSPQLSRRQMRGQDGDRQFSKTAKLVRWSPPVLPGRVKREWPTPPEAGRESTSQCRHNRQNPGLHPHSRAAPLLPKSPGRFWSTTLRNMTRDLCKWRTRFSPGQHPHVLSNGRWQDRPRFAPSKRPFNRHHWFVLPTGPLLGAPLKLPLVFGTNVSLGDKTCKRLATSALHLPSPRFFSVAAVQLTPVYVLPGCFLEFAPRQKVFPNLLMTVLQNPSPENQTTTFLLTFDPSDPLTRPALWAWGPHQAPRSKKNPSPPPRFSCKVFAGEPCRIWRSPPPAPTTAASPCDKLVSTPRTTICVLASNNCIGRPRKLSLLFPPFILTSPPSSAGYPSSACLARTTSSYGTHGTGTRPPPFPFGFHQPAPRSFLDANQNLFASTILPPSSSPCLQSHNPPSPHPHS